MQLSEYKVACDLPIGQLVEVLSAFNNWDFDEISNGHYRRRHLNPRICFFVDFLTTFFVGHEY